MINNGVPDETQQVVTSRQNSRVQSSGTQTSASAPSTATSLTPPITASNSTPTASTTALPRISPNTAGALTSPGSSRSQSSSSTLRAGNSSPISGQVQASSSGSASRSTVPSSSTSALPVRRETLTGHSSSISFGTASSYLSSQQSTTAAPSGSLFGFLGGQRASSDYSNTSSQPYGWRASTSTPINGANTVTSASSPSANTSNIANVYQSSHPSTVASPSFQPRPAITSFLASTSQVNTSWNGQPNHRGATTHNQSNQTGSSIRNHAIVSGISSPWLGLGGNHQQGINGGSHGNGNTGSNSGWTVTDSATARGGWVNSGRLISGFEENQIVSFTWLIPEAHLLRDEVEKSPLPSEGGRSISAGAGKSEVWTTQPIFGDGKWKLELVRTSRPKDESIDISSGNEITQTGVEEEEEEEKEKIIDKMTVLSIYLTSMVLDYSAADLEIPATIMIGIKPVQSQAKACRSGSWIWQEFTHYVFRREHEFYECHNLPSLSALLQDGEIDRQDAFSLTIQISTGPSAAVKASVEEGFSTTLETRQVNPFIVQNNQLVHHSLINGLERLLDSNSTGDVVLVVRERGVIRRQGGGHVEQEQTQDEIWTRPVGTPMFDWGQSQEVAQIVVRDRLLWAHSSILGARSEFFNDMLQSEFAEGQEQNLSTREIAHGETMQIQGRKVKTLRINDADFTTVYWLLRYLYLEEVEFLPSEDVRCAALDDDWMTVGQVSADESNQLAVWQWTPLEQLESAVENYQEQGIQATPASSYASLQQRSDSRHRPGSSSVPLSPDTPSRLHHGPSSPNRSISSLSHEVYSGYQRRVGSDRDAARQSSTRSFTQEAPLPDTPCPPIVTNQFDTSSVSLYQSLFMDPHLHPCEKPPSTSALALYRLAHRYHQQDLVHLAKAQLISSLTPQTAFPTLLATNLYSDLYENVKGYVLDNWEAVSQTSEFERCCDEVSAGEWGVEAGRALRVFMRSLLSPSRAR